MVVKLHLYVVQVESRSLFLQGHWDYEFFERQEGEVRFVRPVRDRSTVGVCAKIDFSFCSAGFAKMNSFPAQEYCREKDDALMVMI